MTPVKNLRKVFVDELVLDKKCFKFVEINHHLLGIDA
jgi:hypothetical protein